MDYPTGGYLARHYRVLGLVPGADLVQVKAAYKRLAKRWHPDRLPTDPRAPARFQKIAQAYRTIVDAKERSLAEFAVFLRGVPARRPRHDLIKDYRAHAISTLLLSRLALTYMEGGMFDEAHDILKRLISGPVPLITSYINLAYLYFIMGSDERALETLYRAREVFGDDPVIALNLSLILKKAGRFLDAVREIEGYEDEIGERGGHFADLARRVSFFDDRKRVIRYLRRAVDQRRCEMVNAPSPAGLVRLLADHRGGSHP